MRTFVRLFIAWVPLAIMIVGVCALIYATVQQNYRESLNDPQIQMAEDIAAKFDQGASVAEVFTPTPGMVDISMSLSPWFALVSPDGEIYQEQRAGGVVFEATTGYLDQKDSQNGPTYQYFSIPTGVLTSASLGMGKDSSILGEDRVTWQPALGVRQALVVVAITNGHYKGSFVVAGRNMREVEDRESALATMIGVGMIVLLIATFVAQWSSNGILKRWK